MMTEAQLRAYKKYNSSEKVILRNRKNSEKYSRDYPIRRMISQAKYRAKKKGLEFDLVESDIIVPETCPVFGSVLVPFGSGTDNVASIDRVDNNKGYTKDNIAVMSARANRRKSDFSLEELEKLVAYLKSLK